MERLRAETGAKIDVPNSSDAPGPDGRVQIDIRGTKAAVDAAKKALEARTKEFDSKVTKTIDVDRQYLQSLIGSGGSNIVRIVKEAGGPERSAEAVKFPAKGSDSSTITVMGTQTVVDKIVASN